jgi:hypothetical protein
MEAQDMIGTLLDQHADSTSKLTIRLVPADEPSEQKGYVLLEGDDVALRFLGELLLAHAGKEGDCGLQLHPNGEGSLHFSSSSDLGVYLHRLPCTDTAPRSKPDPHHAA